MRNWKKTLILPALGIAVMFAALAPTAASAAPGTLTARASDRVTDTRPDVRPDLRPSVTDTGVVRLSEGHTLRARGIGNVSIAGRGKIEGVAYEGTLTVKDIGGDANIDVSARVRRINDDGSITFIGLNGDFEISGSAIKLEFRRTRTHFEAHGQGRFDFQGAGWYQVDGGRHLPWRQ
ncbi:MAG: hypothetical protein HOH95_11100 [Dehalococcoidia bacterium]|jgi:hypothetical protein|nr:hypothetical protein [Dehalococcoidia bacterium]